jgi:hypothetical protein
MKKLLGRLILTVILVISSISVCMPDDQDCNESAECSSMQNSKAEAHSSASQSGEQHHCNCSLTCHNLFINFVSSPAPGPSNIVNTLTFGHIQSAYPQVLISFEKPPLI